MFGAWDSWLLSSVAQMTSHCVLNPFGLGGYGGPGADRSNATDAALADELHEMLKGSMCFPNPVETEIEKRGKLFLESKSTLFILSSAAGQTPATFEKVLKQLKHSQSIENLHLYPVPFWDESDPHFDFSQFSEQMATLPRLESLHVHHMLVKNFELRPCLSLRRLRLVDPQVQDGKWSVQLPQLRELVMENHSPPEKNFARSLLQCPRLEEFFAHKYWHDQALPKLFLPSCKRFTFRRGDCTEKLSLYLPRVEDLVLDACYDLQELTLLKHGHGSHQEFNLPENQQPSKFRISLTNANLGPAAQAALQESGRMLNDLAEFQENDGLAGAAGMDAIFRNLHNAGFFGDDDEGSEGISGSETGIASDASEMDELDDGILGRAVRVCSLQTRQELIGKTGRIIEVYPENGRVGVRFDHDPRLELSLRKESVEQVYPQGASSSKRTKLEQVD
ncbi:unnamed protein product [Effrenium voratum]|nr:unnamed protein product [Effrenium voratum]